MLNIKRKIAVFSGKRGGFGALMGVMTRIEEDPDMELDLIITDMHLSPLFGYTVQEVEKYFKLSHKLELEQVDDTGYNRSLALGRCLIKATNALKKSNPDILLILGDRGEVLSAAIAATELNIPIAHILGGDVSGNRDGNRIHAITKLAHIHFPSSNDAYQRILNLGEENWRVHNVGATYVDYIVQKKYTQNDIARKKYGLTEKEDYSICIQHPTTLKESDAYREASVLFNVLRQIKTRTIIIYPCSDQGYNGVIEAIKENEKVPYFSIYKNIEALDFWGLMSGAKMLIGNSSSGLIETPYFNIPAVNLGRRQKGRIRDCNVIDADYSSHNIKAAIDNALSQEFRTMIKNHFIFGKGNASAKIVKILKTTELGDRLIMKQITY